MNNNHALFLGWKRAIIGREMDSIELFGGFTKYIDTLIEKGTITSHQPYFLDFHGGDLNGFWILNGDRQKLDELQQSDEWIMWNSKAHYTLEGYGVINATTGDALHTRMTSFQKVIK